jgi:hypothetical protein
LGKVGPGVGLGGSTARTKSPQQIAKVKPNAPARTYRELGSIGISVHAA